MRRVTAISAKPNVLQSAKSVQETFDATLAVVQSGDYTLEAISNELHEMLFTSSKTAMSWGHAYFLGVVPFELASGIQLTTDNKPGAPRALLDGRKNKKAGEKLLAQVQAVLDGDTPPAPTPVTSFAKLADGSTVPWTSGDYPGA